MFLKYSTNWDLLAKYMAGEASQEEIAMIDEWLERSDSNKSLFEEIQTDWMKMDKMYMKFDVDNAWNKLHNRIITDDQPEKKEVRKSKVFAGFYTPMRIAASFLILIILGFSIYIITNNLQKVSIKTLSDEKGKEVILPDGSTVFLNNNTKLSYSKHFGKRTREISLTGEAFFNVKHDKNKPFRISAGNASVRVLGTSFNVNMRKNEVEVYVSTGIVELSESGNYNNKILLSQGNIGIIKDKVISQKKAEDKNSIAWKTGELTFNDKPLFEVVSVLNEIYNANIIIRGKGIDTIRIIGSYHGDPLNQILEVIGQQNEQISIVKSEDTIYLSRK